MPKKLKELSMEEEVVVMRKRLGLSLWDLAVKMNMKPTPLYNRLKGYIEFKEEEKVKLNKVLGTDI